MEVAAGETAKPARKRRGCLFWGFLMALLMLVIVGGGLALMVYSLVMEYTSTSPVPVPRYDLKPGEAKAVERRLADFKEPAEAGPPRQLVLTADDLNALIAASPHGDRWAGKVFVRLEGDKAYADISLPLEEIPLLSGRYLNGTLELKVGLEEGGAGKKKDKSGLKKPGPVATVVGGTANGKPLPAEVLRIFEDRNLFEKLSDEAVLEFVKKAKKIEIKDGKLIIQR